jgi:amidase
VHGLIGQILSVALATGLDALGVPDDEISPLAAANRARGRSFSGTEVFAMTNRLAELSDATRARSSPAATWCWRRSCRARRRRWAASRPTTAIIDAHLAKMEALAPNAALANLAGLPALAIPTGMVERCPWACS